MNAFKKIFKSRPEKDGIFFKRMQSILGFKPRVITHYEEALLSLRTFLEKHKEVTRAILQRCVLKWLVESI